MAQDQRKKVLFVVTKSNWGGAQRYVYDLASNLPNDQFEPVVAYGTTGVPGTSSGLLAELLKQNGIRTIFIPELGRDYSITNDRASFRALRYIIRAERPDVLHLNSSKAGGLGAVAGRLLRVPHIVFTAHGWPFWEKDRTILWRAIAWIGSWATMLFSHTTICISEYDLRIAKRMPLVGHKAVRIYNGIAPLTFGNGSVIRNSFPPDAKITGTIGELNPNKNHAALIEQARVDETLHVAIVGEGELRGVLERQIEEYGLKNRVKLFGFISAAKVMKGFDTFALPSKKEGLPYVLLEAKQAGVPIEASRVGGVGEILDADGSEPFSLEKMVRETIAVY